MNKKMNMKEIAQWVAKNEKGKKELNITEIQRVLAVVSDLTASAVGPEVLQTLLNNGFRRKKANERKKRV